jgi:hypothetical protein
MQTQEMLDLKSGDKVLYVGPMCGGWPPNGTVLTCKKSWMDDNRSAQFTWIDEDGDEDYHFFTADELEFIKE